MNGWFANWGKWILHSQLIITIAGTASAQDNWSLKNEKNGIKVYNASTDSSKFKLIKVDCIVEGTIGKLVGIMEDIPHHKTWVYATKKSSLIKRIGPGDMIYYAETALPWPMNNRDAVIHMTLTRDTVKNTLTIATTGKPGLIAENKGLVRVPYLQGTYHVEAITPDKLHIVYTLRVDPGGNTPAWLVNMFSSKGPFETFQSLAEQLKN